MPSCDSERTYESLTNCMPLHHPTVFFLLYVHILPNKNTSCSLFPAFPLTLPSIFFSLVCLPVFQWCFHPPSSYPGFHPSPPPPVAAEVMLEQWSVSLHVSCGTENSTQLCNTQKHGWNQGEEAWKHREGEGEMRNMHCCHASKYPCNTHTKTHAHTIPLLCSNNASTATHKCTQTGSGGTQHKWPKTKPGSEWTKTQESAVKKTVPCSAFRCARPWREKSNGEGQGEKLKTPAHQYYSCIVIMHALRGGKPWLSH